MSALTNLRGPEVEIERREPRKLPKGAWLGVFPNLSDEEVRERARLDYLWPKIEIERWPSITLIRPEGHE